MMIIETCPVCGHDLLNIMLASYPPIPQKRCSACGWSWTGEREEMIRVPFNGDELKPELNEVYTIRECSVQPSDIGFESSACRHCGNNPANGGSGVCHCVLGQQAIC